MTHPPSRALHLDPPPRRIAIIRALQLGDLLLAVPAIRALRRRFPRAEITLIGLPWAAAFVHRFHHLINRFVTFGGYPGIREVAASPARVAVWLAEQRAYGYDLVIQMHGNGSVTNRLALDLAPRMAVGYYVDVLPAGFAAGAPYPEDQHEIWRNLGLARLLGCPDLDPTLEFPLFPSDHAEADALLNGLPRQMRPWIALHSGARQPARRWPPEYFAALADHLAATYGVRIILTGSPDEIEIVAATAWQMRSPARNLAGKTTLGGLAAVIASMDLFISNDTGPAHLATALGTPSVTLFGPVDPARWAPLDQARHPILRNPVPCSPCGYWECPIDHPCLRSIQPDDVLAVAGQLLRKEAPRVALEDSHLAHPRQLP